MKPRHIKLIADNLDAFEDDGLRALGSLGTLARSHADAVAAFLFSYHWKVAVETLKKMEAAEQYIHVAVDLVMNNKKEKKEGGLRLLEAFGKLSASHAGLIAEQFMTAADPLVKEAAIRALVSIGKIEPNVENEIVSVLNQNPRSLESLDGRLIMACIEALSSLGKERMTTLHVDAIANQLEDIRSYVCKAAIRALVSARELLNENHHKAIVRKCADADECAVLAAKSLKSLGKITINVDDYLDAKP